MIMSSMEFYANKFREAIMLHQTHNSLQYCYETLQEDIEQTFSEQENKVQEFAYLDMALARIKSELIEGY